MLLKLEQFSKDKAEKPFAFGILVSENDEVIFADQDKGKGTLCVLSIDVSGNVRVFFFIITFPSFLVSKGKAT